MPENPLLPHRKLRELHALMLRCRELERRGPQRRTHGAREALLAATAMQLLPEDLLCDEPGATTAAQLVPRPRKAAPPLAWQTPAALSRLTAAAGAALGLHAAGGTQLVLAYARAGALEPGWQPALEWAHTLQLPLLLVCADATGGRVSRAPDHLSWLAVSRLARRLRLPVLSVDGEDAVAVYRVMQESVLRARGHGGPAVLWATLTPPGDRPLPRSQQPLARLQRYLSARGL